MRLASAQDVGCAISSILHHGELHDKTPTCISLFPAVHRAPIDAVDEEFDFLGDDNPAADRHRSSASHNSSQTYQQQQQQQRAASERQEREAVAAAAATAAAARQAAAAAAAAAEAQAAAAAAAAAAAEQAPSLNVLDLLNPYQDDEDEEEDDVSILDPFASAAVQAPGGVVAAEAGGRTHGSNGNSSRGGRAEADRSRGSDRLPSSLPARKSGEGVVKKETR